MSYQRNPCQGEFLSSVELVLLLFLWHRSNSKTGVIYATAAEKQELRI